MARGGGAFSEVTWEGTSVWGTGEEEEGFKELLLVTGCPLRARGAFESEIKRETVKGHVVNICTSY